MQEPAVNAEIVLQLVPQQMAGDSVICFSEINKGESEMRDVIVLLEDALK